jgi:dihydropteroate synthase
MGIVNVTPDSFSDGGLYLDARAAAEHGLRLAREGAAILDVGGESTRPGAEPVGAEEELRRVVPVIERIAARMGIAATDAGIAPRDGAMIPSEAQGGTRISIDTSKAVVARAALAAGASFVNDVTALRGDPEMAAAVAESGADCCLMHMLGEPRTMQSDPRYEDVVDDVKSFLEERLAFAVRAGVAEQRILLDPGIGFGKTVEHNLQLLRRLDELLALGCPIVIGTSRKSFLGRIAEPQGSAVPPAATPLGATPPGTIPPGPPGGAPRERLTGTIATNVMALERGASVFRVHDVAPVVAALRVAAATLSGTWGPSAASSQTTTRS